MSIPPTIKVVVALAFCQSASAVTLASYAFSTDLNVTATAANVSATAFGGTGTSRSSSSYAFQYTQAANAGYMEFGLTAAPGYQLDLSTINFSYDFIQSAGTNNPVTANIALVYSTDSFATSTPIVNYSRASGANTSGAPGFTTTLPGGVDLSGIANLQDIKFRFVLTNGGSLNTTNYRYAIDNVSIVGDVVAVPEPSITAAVWIGLGSLGLRRRKG